uniref:C2H2-type domain-containing protein n=1 Tax=Ananas comosus var. bracteatus TaxID=296719 RepID=A0A6V7Q355_ANACO|nr:unnamed protein product [Ananas comosus var. bracteatus]
MANAKGKEKKHEEMKHSFLALPNYHPGKRGPFKTQETTLRILLLDISHLHPIPIPAFSMNPDAEVVSLSPRTLLESDRYVCEICKKGFQRDQNLQMHRRRHKVPWKLAKRTSPEAGGGGGRRRRQRVYVCPEPNCLHHEAGHALGDLVGIKKHFRRKHGGRRQWGCGRCGRAYAVQSDYKAHLKTCGTRGHSCDCGRVFSR